MGPVRYRRQAEVRRERGAAWRGWRAGRQLARDVETAGCGDFGLWGRGGRVREATGHGMFVCGPSTGHILSTETENTEEGMKQLGQALDPNRKGMKWGWE